MPMSSSIDRIEDGIATLEWSDLVTVQIPESELPPNACEGDILVIIEDGSLVIDHEETRRRRKSNLDLFNSLLEG